MAIRVLATDRAALVLMLLGAFVSFGCGASGSAAPRDGVLEIQRGEFVQRLVLTGELRAVRSDPILIPRTPGWQVQIRWLLGDGTAVRAGDRVAELDTTALLAHLEEGELRYVQALQDLAEREAGLDAREEELWFELERTRTALEKARLAATVPEDLLSPRHYQERQLQLERAQVAHEKALMALESFRETAEAELEVLRLSLAKAEREVARAERAIDALVLRAPRDGLFIVSLNPQQGRRFQVGDQAWFDAEIGRIPDLSQMEVEAALFDVDEGKIQPGNGASCILDAYPQTRYACRVEEIAPVAQPTEYRSLRRDFRVRVALERTDPQRMRPGMSVRVEVEPARLSEVTLAPREALDLDAHPPRLWLENGRTIEVAVGPCDARRCVLEAGPPPGTRLGRAAGS